MIPGRAPIALALLICLDNLIMSRTPSTLAAVRVLAAIEYRATAYKARAIPVGLSILSAPIAPAVLY